MRERMFLHVDGDGFFAGCEVAKDHRLRGKPVVVGKDRGIALAMTYEAKALGIKRGMKIREIKERFPQAIIVSTDFGAYTIFSRRMTNIVSRYSTSVEHYSIDECFADVMAQKTPTPLSPQEFARRIKHDLETELGMTFSVGVAPTKVLAKIASSHSKPSGCTILAHKDIDHFLRNISVGDIWGIGHQTVPKLLRYGIRTALMFKVTPLHVITSHFSLPYQNIWHELHGRAVFSLHTKEECPKSLARTRTFLPTKDPSIVFAQLTNNIELALVKLRRHKCAATGARFFFKTQTFFFYSETVLFDSLINTPHEAIRIILPRAAKLFRTDTLYRATGITFFGIENSVVPQQNLFETTSFHVQKEHILYQTIDALQQTYGKRSIFLLGSKLALEQKELSEHTSLSSLLGIPYIGEIS